MLLPVEVPSDTEVPPPSKKPSKKRFRVRKLFSFFLKLSLLIFFLFFSPESMTVGPHPKPGPNDMVDDDNDDPKPRRASHVSSRHSSGLSVHHRFESSLDLFDLFLT